MAQSESAVPPSEVAEADSTAAAAAAAGGGGGDSEDKKDAPASSKVSPSKKETEVVTKAMQYLAAGKRNLLVKDIPGATSSLEEACRLLAEHYGETAKECGEAYFYYGRALLELARLEAGVIDNAFDGVNESSDEEKNDSQVGDPNDVTINEAIEIIEKVDEALEENYKASEEILKKKQNGHDSTTTTTTSSEKTESMEVEETDDDKKDLKKDTKDEGAEKDEAKPEDKKDDDKKAVDEGKKADEKAKVDEEESKPPKDEQTTSKKDDTESEEKSEEDEEQEEGDEEQKEEEEQKKENDDDEEEEGEDQGEKEKVETESIGSNEAGTSVVKDDVDKVAVDKEEEEDPSNLQLAWEMLELAKTIFSKHADSITDAASEKRLELESRLSETYQLLGEVSIENENYEQAVEDLTSCLRRRQELLPSDSRSIAETHYQLGVALGFNLQFDKAVEALEASIGVLEQRITNLNAKTESKDPTKKDDAFYTREKEIEEITGLIPEIKEKIVDTRDMQKETLKKIREQNGGGGGRALGNKKQEEEETTTTTTTTTTTASAAFKSEDSKPVSNITNLVKKRKKTAEEEGGGAGGDTSGSGAKKPHLETNGAEKTNGTATTATSASTTAAKEEESKA